MLKDFSGRTILSIYIEIETCPEIKYFWKAKLLLLRKK